MLNNDQIIYCPTCKTSISVDKLGDYVNDNPKAKKQIIEEEIQQWGEAYDRHCLIKNVLFCRHCYEVSHLTIGASHDNKKRSESSRNEEYKKQDAE